MFPLLNKVPVQDRKVFIIDSLSGAYYGMFMGFFYPFVPLILKKMNASPLQMGLCMGIPFFAAMLSLPVLKLFNGFKAINLVAFPTMLFRPIVLLIALFTDPWAILAVFMANQFIEMATTPAYTRLLREMYSNAGRSSAMGYVRSYQAVCQILGSVLSGLLIDNGNGVLAFFLAGSAGLISSINFLRIMPQSFSPVFNSKNFNLLDAGKAFKENLPFLWLNLTIMLYGFGNLIVNAILPNFLVEKFEISHFQLGSLTAVTNFSLVLSYAFLGRFTGRRGPQRGLFLSFMWGIFIPWLFIFSPNTNFLAFPYFLLGIQNAGFDLTWPQLLIKNVEQDSIPTYTAVYLFLMGIRGVLASLVGNLFYPSLGGNFFLVFAGIFMILGLILGLFSRKSWEGK
ncbi:MAG: MFS transporter [Candidatus Riflebacteria bacterium]|nr:MFS transporter [Candidatus Riflebacteria bacterium]